MKDELTIKDFLLFLKDNLKLIFTSVAIMIVLLFGFLVFNFFSQQGGTPTESLETSEEQIDSLDEEFSRLAEVPFELLNTREVTFLQDYVENTAFRFMFFVENESGEPIGNLNMMRAIFRHENIVDQIEDKIGEQLTPNPVISVNVLSFADSGLFQLQLGREDRESSEELAQVMFEMVENNEIPVLNQFNVSIFEETPIPLREIIEPDEYDDTAVADRNTSGLIRDVIIYSVMGIFAGLFVGILAAIIKMYQSKKITALFNYERDFTDKIVRLNHLNDAEESIYTKAKQNVIYPTGLKKLLLVDNQPQKKVEEFIKTVNQENDILIANDFSEINNNYLVEEVIIITEVNKSLKQWYNNQRIQLNGFNIPIKIIQF